VNVVLGIRGEGLVCLDHKASISRFLFATQVMADAGIGYRILSFVRLSADNARPFCGVVSSWIC